MYNKNYIESPLFKKLVEINEQFLIKRGELEIEKNEAYRKEISQYLNDNDPVKLGDVITDGDLRILVSARKISLTGQHKSIPIATIKYYGRRLSHDYLKFKRDTDIYELALSQIKVIAYIQSDRTFIEKPFDSKEAFAKETVEGNK